MCQEWLQGLGKIKGLTLRDIGPQETASGSSKAQQGVLPLGEAVYLRNLPVRTSKTIAPPLFLKYPFEEDILPPTRHLQELNFSEAARRFLCGMAPEVEHTLIGTTPCRYAGELPSSPKDTNFSNTIQFVELCKYEVQMQEARALNQANHAAAQHKLQDIY